MRCPFCGENKDKVIDSRSADGGEAIRRRRECMACGKRFTTYEHIEKNAKLMVVKKDGSRVPFDRNKIRTGLEKACYKRSVTVDEMAQIVNDIEDELLRSGNREIESINIGNMVAERLRRLDEVAYVRFASVYRQFKTIDDLFEEMREVISDGAEKPGPNQGRLFNG